MRWLRRSHDWNSSFSNNNGGVDGGEQNFQQPWSPAYPPSSNAFDRKKLKLGGYNNGGTKVKPPKVSLKKSCSSKKDDSKSLIRTPSNASKSWATTGYTLLSDMKSDLKHRSFINIVAYSPGGAVTVNSFDVSKEKKTGLCLKLSPHRHHRLQLNHNTIFPSTRTTHRLNNRAVSHPTSVSSSSNDVVPKGVLEKDPRALWTRYVDWLYQHKDLGLYLDVSRVGFTDQFFQEMEPRLVKAFNDMEELEKGAIANPDEGRMVGHYWLRNSKLAPKPILTHQIDTTLDRICHFADQVITGKIRPPSEKGCFTQILSIGIGGSALGPQFVAEALAPDNPPLKIRFIDNTDPAGIDHQIAQLGSELASTLVIVVSKSGGTPETRNGLLEVQKAFREAGLDFAKQGVAITQDNSLLDNTARIEGWLARFPMFDWVGGRTSEMSAVGLLAAALQVFDYKLIRSYAFYAIIVLPTELMPSAFASSLLQGIDIKEMLAGAALMDEANRTRLVRNNPAALLALCWYWSTGGLGSKDMVVLPYKDSLLLFSRYLQQLVMESLGKEFDLDGNRVNQGLTVYGNKGSTDQHAYIQQLRDGVHNFFVTFIEVLRDRPPGHDWELEPGVTCGDYLFGFLQGTRSALYANDRESITVTVQEVTPRSVGALVALYERAVGIYASLVNINAYHQPGVEAGKKAAGEVLALQKRVLAVLNDARFPMPFSFMVTVVGLYVLADLGFWCFFGVFAVAFMTVYDGDSCKEPVEPLTLDEIAERCHAPEEIEMIYKIIAHMAANDRALIAEGSCGSPRSVKVFLGECNVDAMYA
ncbi:hypothetical protein BUALT_Bualt15G0124800 [Buddleja alternifolia]|uniref:Glucose-6-phosphate isomerase n=1 Tax=Buddleja alternifolia TaxID=168488 RepID=A0AAV6WMW4_9LAMI|nr:hypothetical protein BUALT_Bualt15G0124800 [Buddleja alternifolia]